MRRANLVIPIVLGLVSVVAWHDTSSYPGSMIPGVPGGAAFPRALAVSLFVLATLLLVGALRRDGEPETHVGWKGVGKNSALLGMLVLFVLLGSVWDFYVLLYVIVAGTMGIMGERSKRALLGLPILFVAFVYVVFHRVFGVDFPSAYP